MPAALRASAKGARVISAGIHMSDIPSFPYELLWEERTLGSVANLTRVDGEEFIALAPARAGADRGHGVPAGAGERGAGGSARRPLPRRRGARGWIGLSAGPPAAGYGSGMAATLDELTVADPPGAWAALGFAVDGDTCVVGAVRIRLAGADAGRGLVGWSLRGAAAADLDGLATTRSDREPPAECPVASQRHHRPRPRGRDQPRPRPHRRGAGAAGLDLRRIREEPTPAGAPRQAFFRLGAAILEVVQEPAEASERAGGRPPRLLLGPRLRRPRPRRHRRRARRPGQRGPAGGPARPPHRHPAPRRRPLAAGGADDPATAALGRGRRLGLRAGVRSPRRGRRRSTRPAAAGSAARPGRRGRRGSSRSAAWRRRSRRGSRAPTCH